MFSLKRLFKLALILTLIVSIALFALYLTMRDELPSVQSLKENKWQIPMQIYSADGELISQFGEKKRIPLTLDDYPEQLVNALLATEDERFYLHFGVDPIGMTRAVWGQIIGQNKGGASTITMQLARNFFLTREVTYTRKLREIFISFHIESLLTKREILELYMNKIELGHRAFGFGAAAQVYYGKDVKDLTLAQIAVLAGLPKAPSTMNPISRPDRARERRAVVLKRMLVSDYITTQEYEEALNAPITAKKHGAEITLDAPYIAEMANQEMLERYGRDEAYTAGYKVYLTVPSKLQRAAENAMISNLYDYDMRHGYRGAVLSLRPEWKAQIVGDEPVKSNELIELVPLTEEEINSALTNAKEYDVLQAAIVTEVAEQSATIALKNGQTAEILWDGMKWAREFISDTRQGPAPKAAEEILTYGDVIYVKTTPEGLLLSQMPSASAAMVAISPDNGAIQAVVGGYSFKQSQFNRVTQAKRQVGSNIKPFIYSAALEHGFTLASIINDAPINQWDKNAGIVWRPKNSPPKYVGPIRVRQALAESKNVVAVRLMREVGIRNMIDYLTAFGFAQQELPIGDSLALGSASLTPLQVVTGFATFANGGFLVEPYLIDRIEDPFGNVVFQANPAIACDDCGPVLQDETLTASTTPMTTDPSTTVEQHGDVAEQAELFHKAERVISKQNAFLITQALNSAIWGADWSIKPGWQGTGFRARNLKRRDIAGKTGTTNEAKDAWFSGFSRRMVATSWIGFDDHRRNLGLSLKNANLGDNQITGKEFGAKSAQPAWIKFMETALEELPVEPFEQPEDVVTVRIDKASGKLTKKTDKTSVFEYFIIGSAPKEYVTKDVSGDIFDTLIKKEEPEEEIFE